MKNTVLVTMYRLIPIMLVFFMSLTLASCASNVTVAIQSVEGVNLNVLDVGSPIAITVYQLEKTEAFEKASYQQLTTTKVEGVLGQQTWVIVPGKKNTQVVHLLSKTKKLGIVAAYRTLDNKPWKIVKDFGWITRTIEITVSKEGIR